MKDVTDPEVAKVKKLVALGLEVDANEPSILVQRAAVEGELGNEKAWKKYLALAKAQATLRGDQQVLDIVARQESQGPGQRLAIRLFNEGMKLVQQERYRAAEDKFEEALRRAPGDPQIEIMLGQCYAVNGDLARGIRLIEQAKAHALTKHAMDLVARADEMLTTLRRLNAR